MKKYVFITILCFLFFGCSKETEQEKKDSACPLALPVNKQSFKFYLNSGNPPANVSVIYNGVEKLNSCTNIVNHEYPRLELSFANENPKLSILAYQYGGIENLPSQIDFEVFDLKDCQQEPVSYFSAKEIPLEYEVTNIGPASCNLKQANANVGILKE